MKQGDIEGFGLCILGGPWDLVTTYDWAYNPTYNTPRWAYRGYPRYKSAIIPVMGKYDSK